MFIMRKEKLLIELIRNLFLLTALSSGSVFAAEAEISTAENEVQSDSEDKGAIANQDNSQQNAIKDDNDQIEALPDMVIRENKRFYQVEKSTAGTRFPVELERVPQSIQIINKDLIEDKG